MIQFVILQCGNPSKLIYWCWCKEKLCYIKSEEKKILNKKWPRNSEEKY